jgi:hypothetical protein
MIRAFAKLWAKWHYVWKQEVDAATAEMSALAAAARGEQKRSLMGQLNAQADAIRGDQRSLLPDSTVDYCGRK